MVGAYGHVTLRDDDNSGRDYDNSRRDDDNSGRNDDNSGQKGAGGEVGRKHYNGDDQRGGMTEVNGESTVTTTDERSRRNKT